MKRYALGIYGVLGVFCASIANAQDKPDVLVSGPGIKLGESTVLHPVVGIEGGAISNVFYEDDEASPKAAGVLRLLTSFEIRPAGADRMGGGESTGAPTIDFNVGGEAIYNEYMSSQPEIRDQRSLDLGLSAGLSIFPQGVFRFDFSDKFERLTRPRGFESSENLDRDINHFTAQASFQPGGHMLQFSGRYENTIDVFEDESAVFSNRMHQLLGAQAKWKFFPYSEAWLDASYGFYGKLGDGPAVKQGSNPLRVSAGLATLLHESITVRVWAGYANGFYSSGPSYSIPEGGAEVGWRYMMPDDSMVRQDTGRVLLSYQHIAKDSANANFYVDDAIRLGIRHLVGRVMVQGQVGTRFRHYEGLPMSLGETTRDDFIVEAGARLEFLLKDRVSLYADYALQLMSTDYVSESGVSPSFVRHTFVVGTVFAF